MELNQNLALSKQFFEELIGLVSLDSLARGDCGVGAKRKRTLAILTQLVILLKEIDKVFSERLEHVGDPPILQISSGLKVFYLNVLEPNSQMLRDSFWDMFGFSEARSLFEGVYQTDSPTPIARTIDVGMDRWVNSLTDEELEFWRDEGFDIEEACNFVNNKNFFAPDFWKENLRLLRPVLVECPRSVPSHIHFRLREIYRAFTFGLWMSVIALSRSVAEYAIIHNAPRLNFEPTYEWRGEKRNKGLEQLVDEIATIRPELSGPLDFVRDAGNQILHARKKNRDVEIIFYPKVMRDHALECVRQTRYIIESLYASQGPQKIR